MEFWRFRYEYEDFEDFDSEDPIPERFRKDYEEVTKNVHTLCFYKNIEYPGIPSEVS